MLFGEPRGEGVPGNDITTGASTTTSVTSGAQHGRKWGMRPLFVMVIGDSDSDPLHGPARGSPSWRGSSGHHEQGGATKGVVFCWLRRAVRPCAAAA